MSKKNFDKKLVFWVVVTVLAVFTAVNMISSAAEWRGENVTDFYEDFKEFKDITSLSELQDYCKDNKLEYVMQNSKITVNEFDATFKVMDNDLIEPDFRRELVCYELLDKEEMTEVKLSAKDINHKIAYVYTINDGFNQYTKINGEFYAKNLGATLGRFLLAIAASLIIIGLPVVAGYMRFTDIQCEQRKRNLLSGLF